MGRRYRSRGAPPWWPATEPWPPVRPGGAWRVRRTRFVRRASAAFTILLIFSAIGVIRLVGWIAHGWGGTRAPLPPFLTAFATVILLLAVGSLAMRRVGLPLGDLVGAANRLADGDFSARIEEHGPPSLRMVAHAFNSMAARLQQQEQQRRHLMADIAHELRTPLTVMQGRIEGLLDGVYPRDDARLTELVEEIRMLARLVDDLQTLATTESGAFTLQKQPTDIDALIDDVVRRFAVDASAQQVRIETRTASGLPSIAIDPLRIREVIGNLLSNALRHTPAGGTVTIDAGLTGNELIVAVGDTGTGIAEQDLPKIFDRFYKGDRSHGSGLGLTIARQLVEAHGGEIHAASQPGAGTTIRFTLPLSGQT